MGDLLDRHAWRSLLARTRAPGARVDGHRYALDEDPRVLPTDTSRLEAIAGEGWLALGDAAAAYDPLSSHGIGSAMGSGFYAGNAIADLLAGYPEALPAYLGVMRDAYAAYLELRTTHYTAEGWWPDAPFWARRRGGWPANPSPPAHRSRR